MSEPRPFSAPVLTPSLRWLLTITVGLVVGNLYYNQPLLPLMAQTFDLSSARAGLVATLAQAGYAAGLLFCVPLGDVVERRRLIPATLLVVAVALVGMATAPNFALLCVASFAVGLTTIAPQIVIPLGAGLATPSERGRVIGQLMGGLFVGILGGRVLAGLVGEHFGWRLMFALAAAMMLVLAAVLSRLLPRVPAAAALSYGALLRSLLPLAREHAVLRDAALLGALIFAGFSAFWTTLGFRLATAPLHYGSDVAGLFGLLGIAGALVAPFAGRLADRASPRRAVGIAVAGNVLGWIALALGGHTLVGLAAGVVLLDAGTQAAQVSNQTRVYALPAFAHSRLNTIYMVAYFTGGALGSVLGATAWAMWGWAGVCGVGLATTGLAAVILAARRNDPRVDGRVVAPPAAA